MIPEEKAAADAKVVEEKAAADAKVKADAEAKAKDPVYLEAELKKVIAERDAHKARVKELTPAAAKLKEIEDAAKSTEVRLTEENASLKATAERADALEKLAATLLDQEIADIPENMKALIPKGKPEEQLLWVRSARAAGVFGTQKQGEVGGRMPGAGGGNTMKASEFFALPLDGKFEEAEKRRKVGTLTVVP